MRRLLILIVYLCLSINLVLIEPAINSWHNVSAYHDEGEQYNSERSLRVFDDIWNRINNKYYDTKFNGVDWLKIRDRYRPQAASAATEEQLYDLLQKMLKELRDEHVAAFGPSFVKQLKKRTLPDVGIKLGLVEDQVVVREVKPFSIAADAGIQAGWILTHVGDQPVDKRSGFSAEKGDKLKFKFLDTDEKERTIEIECCPDRAITPTQTSKLLAQGIVYIRFDSFAPRTAEWLNDVLKSNSNTSALIIDLRSNPGGELDVLAQSLKPFFTKDTVLGEYTERSGKKQKIKVAGSGKKAYSGDVIVLTGPGSASCSEIFAAAIQEAGRGKIIGRTTRGSVLPSIIERLSDNGELQFSIANYLTIKGRRLEGAGVKPDLTIEPKLADLKKGIDPDVASSLQMLVANKDHK